MLQKQHQEFMTPLAIIPVVITSRQTKPTGKFRKRQNRLPRKQVSRKQNLEINVQTGFRTHLNTEN